jgi:hypothetical protein
MNTYEAMTDESDGVSSEEPFGVHSLVPVTPVLNYLLEINKRDVHLPSIYVGMIN